MKNAKWASLLAGFLAPTLALTLTSARADEGGIHSLTGKFQCVTPSGELDVMRQLEFGGSKIVITTKDNRIASTELIDGSSKLSPMEKKMGFMLVEGKIGERAAFSFKIYIAKAGELLMDASDHAGNDDSESTSADVKFYVNYVCSKTDR